jgi:hypothetical protein
MRAVARPGRSRLRLALHRGSGRGRSSSHAEKFRRRASGRPGRPGPLGADRGYAKRQSALGGRMRLARRAFMSAPARHNCSALSRRTKILGRLAQAYSSSTVLKSAGREPAVSREPGHGLACARLSGTQSVGAACRARLRAGHSITATRVKAATPSTITASSTASYRGSPSLRATRADIVVTASSGSAVAQRAAARTVPGHGRLRPEGACAMAAR